MKKVALLTCLAILFTASSAFASWNCVRCEIKYDHILTYSYFAFTDTFNLDILGLYDTPAYTPFLVYSYSLNKSFLFQNSASNPDQIYISPQIYPVTTTDDVLVCRTLDGYIAPTVEETLNNISMEYYMLFAFSIGSLFLIPFFFHAVKRSI